MKTLILKVILKEEEDRRWSASIPTLSGCSSWGYSKQEALDNIKDAAEIYIEDMIDAGEGIPPSSDTLEIIEEAAVAVSLWSINLKIFLFAISFGHWSKTDSNIESAREAKEYIATVMEGVLLFITIIPRKPYLLELF
jgi:antitoxin HicB